eukprot:Ihof_evm2s455 gene=Ihof_evmTU2s455
MQPPPGPDYPQYGSYPHGYYGYQCPPQQGAPYQQGYTPQGYPQQCPPGSGLNQYNPPMNYPPRLGPGPPAPPTSNLQAPPPTNNNISPNAPPNGQISGAPNCQMPNFGPPGGIPDNRVPDRAIPGADIGEQSKSMQDWLFEAVTTRNVMLLKFVIQAGVDINAVDVQNDTAPLITAAKLCYNDVLDVLLTNGANPNITDKKGWTAIHWAAVMNNVTAVELLCNHGVDIFPRTHGGKSALDLAVLKNHREVKNFLLKWSAEIGRPMNETSPIDTGIPLSIPDASSPFNFGRDRALRACVECKSTKT